MKKVERLFIREIFKFIEVKIADKEWPCDFLLVNQNKTHIVIKQQFQTHVLEAKIIDRSYLDHTEATSAQNSLFEICKEVAYQFQVFRFGEDFFVQNPKVFEYIGNTLSTGELLPNCEEFSASSLTQNFDKNYLSKGKTYDYWLKLLTQDKCDLTQYENIEILSLELIPTIVQQYRHFIGTNNFIDAFALIRKWLLCKQKVQDPIDFFNCLILETEFLLCFLKEVPLNQDRQASNQISIIVEYLCNNIIAFEDDDAYTNQWKALTTLEIFQQSAESLKSLKNSKSDEVAEQLIEFFVQSDRQYNFLSVIKKLSMNSEISEVQETSLQVQSSLAELNQKFAEEIYLDHEFLKEVLYLCEDGIAADQHEDLDQRVRLQQHVYYLLYKITANLPTKIFISQNELNQKCHEILEKVLNNNSVEFSSPQISNRGQSQSPTSPEFHTAGNETGETSEEEIHESRNLRARNQPSSNENSGLGVIWAYPELLILSLKSWLNIGYHKFQPNAKYHQQLIKRTERFSQEIQYYSLALFNQSCHKNYITNKHTEVQTGIVEWVYNQPYTETFYKTKKDFYKLLAKDSKNIHTYFISTFKKFWELFRKDNQYMMCNFIYEIFNNTTYDKIALECVFCQFKCLKDNLIQSKADKLMESCLSRNVIMLSLNLVKCFDNDNNGRLIVTTQKENQNKLLDKVLENVHTIDFQKISNCEFLFDFEVTLKINQISSRLDIQTNEIHAKLYRILEIIFGAKLFIDVDRAPYINVMCFSQNEFEFEEPAFSFLIPKNSRIDELRNECVRNPRGQGMTQNQELFEILYKDNKIIWPIENETDQQQALQSCLTKKTDLRILMIAGGDLPKKMSQSERHVINKRLSCDKCQNFFCVTFLTENWCTKYETRKNRNILCNQCTLRTNLL